jgi:hypothetical protein
VASPIIYEGRRWLALRHRGGAIRAAAAGNGLYDLDLFAATGVLDKVPDVDHAIGAGVRALQAGVMRLYGIVAILGRWVRGCARLCGVHEGSSSWAGSREMGGLRGAILRACALYSTPL